MVQNEKPFPEPPCIFCKIVSGALPASTVHQDEIAVAFMDINPVTRGHLLVIPKRHFSSLVDLPEEAGAHLFTIAQRLAQKIRLSGLRCDGVNLFLADGEVAGQEVLHCHLHVIPRFAGDGFDVRAGHRTWPSREELDAVAQQIRGPHK